MNHSLLNNGATFPIVKRLLSASVLTAFVAVAFAQSNSSRMLPMTPEEQLRSFQLPSGFTISLVASEADGVVKPIDLTFDDAGRLWTQTASMYPLDPFGGLQWDEQLRLLENTEAQKTYPEFKRVLDLYQGRTRGQDKILIIPDPHQATPSPPLVWADGLAIPQSILPYKNGAYVAQGSDLFLLNDSNNDGKADQRVPLLTGFGITDTHTMTHALVRAPGGWVHFSQGALNKGEVTSLVSGVKARVDYSKILRMSLDGSRFNIVSSGLDNIWGFQLRAGGQWYGTGANDRGWSVIPLEAGTGFEGVGAFDDRIRPYQPSMPPLHEFRVGGTGISGLAFAEDEAQSFPREWRDVALLANPITSSINAVRIVRNADGSVTAKHLPDLLTSKDNWFRPVNIEFGPDGCLYVADWYNKIISHNEVPRDHPERDRSRGRIWRICHQGGSKRQIPDLYRTRNAELIRHLQAPSLWEKRGAWHQIVDRNAKELAPSLVALARDRSRDQTTRIHALWSLEGIGHYDAKLMQSLLGSPHDELRREAVRALGSFSLSPASLARHLKGVTSDANVMVRSQLLRTLLESGEANREIIDILVGFCRPDVPGDSLGGPYERKFERYLARMALERHQAELADYLGTRQAKQQPTSHLFWATQALPQPQRVAQFLTLWPRLRAEPLDQAGFIIIAQLLSDSKVIEAVKPLFDDANNSASLAELAKQNRELVQSAELAKLLQTPALRLIRSQDKAMVDLGLDIGEKFKIPGLRDAVVAIVRAGDKGEDTLSLALAILDENPKENVAVFTELLARENLPFGLKRAAMISLAKADAALAREKLQSELRQVAPAQRRLLVTDLSSSPQGAHALLGLLDGKSLTYEDFDFPSARLLLSQRPDDERARTLYSAWEQREQKSKQATQQRVKELVPLALKSGGNPKTGEELFTSLCLSCHVVGGKGAAFAPALDGSGHRDAETLLTSIIDPDAAVEMGYSLTRIIKGDGSIIEGYLYKFDERGATLRFMGGGEMFLDKGDIKELQPMWGQSVMPRGLIDSLTDAQVEDLLAYIRTLR